MIGRENSACTLTTTFGIPVGDNQNSLTAGPRGEACIRYDCVQHPRLYQLRQRQHADGEWRSLFYVEGIPAQHYEDPVEALAAMEANPCS